MANAAPTIPALKQFFINTQTSLLAQPLAPSRNWNAANDASDEAIPDRVLQDALFALNNKIQQHCRRVHAPQASRNVAEQINSAYNKDAERRVGGDEDLVGGIGRESDLTDGETIEGLPQTWISDKEITAHPMESKRYADAVQQLQELSEKRKQLKDQVARISRLKAIVEPLQTTEGGAGVQENIITRNGAIEKELEKMRFLLARVGGRVGTLPQAPTPGVLPTDNEAMGDGGLVGSRKRRVDQFLADQNVFPS